MEEKGKPNLIGMTMAELADFVERIGQPRYRSQQIFEWLYARGAEDIDAMTNLGKAFRAQLKLASNLESLELAREQGSSLDGTKKYLFRLRDGLHVESVLIPSAPSSAVDDEEADEAQPTGRLTLCVSTQVGCPLDCAFCATGTMGFSRNLSVAEILGQVLSIRRRNGNTLTNLVFMGMGEPLLNYDKVMTAAEILSTGVGIAAKRITVSTAGRPDRIRQMADEKRRVKLAISLHSAVDVTRSKLMPINRKFSLQELGDAIEYYYRATRQRITYEVIFFEGVNDTERELKALIKFAGRVPCKINAIPFHSISFTSPSGFAATLRPSPRVEELVNTMRAHHLTVMIRSSAGEDIDAACGQLAVTPSINAGLPA